MKSKFITLLLFTLFSTQISYTQNNNSKGGVISGKMISADNGQPLEFSNIRLFKSSDSSLVTGLLTGSDGLFSLKEIKPGKYYMVIELIGFEDKRFELELSYPDKMNIDLGNIEVSESVNTLDGVEISAQKSYVEYRLDKKVINVTSDLSAMGGSAVNLLENAPSVNVDLEGNVTLRGSSSFTVLINGKPTALKGSEALDQIPATSIEKIEIITNPSAKYDPDGTGGIINVVLTEKKGTGVSGIVNAKAGSNDKYGLDFLLNVKRTKVNYFVGGDINTTPYSLDLSYNRENLTSDTIVYTTSKGTRNLNRGGYNIRTGFDYQIAKNTTFGLSYSGGLREMGMYSESRQSNYNSPETFYNRIATTTDKDRESVYNEFLLSFSHNFKGEEHYLSGSAQYTNEVNHKTEVQDEFIANSNWESTGQISEKTRNFEDELENEFRAKLDYTNKISNGKLEAGYQLWYHFENEDFKFEDYDTTFGIWTNNANFTSDMSFKRNINAVYTTWNSSVIGIEYMLGLRGEYTDRQIIQDIKNEEYIVNRFDLFPTLHLSKQIGNKNQIMASYSRRINRPRGRDLDPFESYIDAFTLRVGDPGLLPEYTNAYEISYQYKFGKSFISAEAYHRQTYNGIERILSLKEDGTTLLKTSNIDNTYATGGELVSNIIIKKGFTINIGGNIFLYEIKDESNGSDIDKNSLNFDLRASVNYPITKTTRIQASYMYTGKSVSPEGYKEPMHMANFGMRQTFLKERLSLTASLRDPFNTAKMVFVTESEVMHNRTLLDWESPVLNFTLTYKLNNFKQSKDSFGGEGMGGMDSL